MDGMIILKRILKTWSVDWTQQVQDSASGNDLRVHKWREISWRAERLPSSLEALFSVYLVKELLDIAVWKLS